MKKILQLFLLIFSAILFSQSHETIGKLLVNQEKSYVGKINNTETIYVHFSKVETKAESQSFDIEGYTKVDNNQTHFKGTITVDAEATKTFNSDLNFFNFEFKDEQKGKHSGILSGTLVMKILAEIISVSVFEGNWESHDKELKYPVFFDNSSLFKEYGRN